MKASCSHVVDLGDLVIEGFLEVAVGLDIAFHLFESLHFLDISCDILVFIEELVVGQPLYEITLLEQVKVEERQLSNKIIFLAEIVDDWGHFSLGNVAELLAILSHVTRASNSTLHIFELGVHHVDFTLLFRSGTKEFRCVGCSQVDHDGVDVRELCVLVDQVGDRREIKAECVLN